MAPEKFISVKEMINYMRSAAPFSITYVTYDKRRGTGGSVKVVERAVMLTHNAKEDAAAKISSPQALTFSIKNPQHFNNSTLNIRVTAMGNADVRKVHVQLIRKFNGATVK